MLGLSLIGGIILVILVVILLMVEVAFWIILIGGLGLIALFLWAAGLHEAAISIAFAIAIIWVGGWAIYRFIKWDLDRMSNQPKAEGRSLAWRIHDLMQAPLPIRSSGRLKFEAPPEDPEERYLWANRLGRFGGPAAGNAHDDRPER